MPKFSIKKKQKKTNMVLEHFILPVDHFKANLFFPIMTPPNPPHHSEKTWIGRTYYNLFKVVLERQSKQN